MRITKIDPHKYKKQFRSIFIDGNFAFKLHEEILLKNNLSEGIEVGQEQLDALQFEGTKKEASEYGTMFLSYRSRSEKEMRDRLKRKKFAPQVIDAVIQEFKNNKLIDDLEFAQSLTESRLKNQLWGRRRIVQDLVQKGVQPKIAEEVSQTIEQQGQTEILNEDERAFQTLLRRAEQMKTLDSHTRYRRLYAHLVRRGFSFDTVEKALNRYKREINEKKHRDQAQTGAE